MVQLKEGGKENETAATASLLRATHLNPDLGEAWGTLAEIALRNDQLSIAEQHLEKARKLQPDVVRWRLVEARILNRRGQAEQAAAVLTALRPEQRNEPVVLGVLAESYGLMRRPADAAAIYAQASKAAATPSPELAYQAALWFERAGDKGQAMGFAKTAAMLGHADAAEMAARLEGAK
jgi:predicted Zn-dependent protease